MFFLKKTLTSDINTSYEMNKKIGCTFVWTGYSWTRYIEIIEGMKLESQLTLRFQVITPQIRGNTDQYLPPIFETVNYMQTPIAHILVTIVTKRKTYLRTYTSLMESQVHMDIGMLYIGNIKIKMNSAILIFSDCRDHMVHTTNY